ncbi:MAG: hypothetical protein IPL49_19025 [Saprospirales bacterium]|nr:hypothetical protein [Saprospirales bacterium]
MRSFSLFVSLFLGSAISLFSQEADDVFHFSPHHVVQVDLPTYTKIGPLAAPHVDESTGHLSYSVPLYTVTCGSNGLPIALSYGTGGFKPTDYPGDVGLGWSISVGASISRVMNGYPDESTFGFWNEDPIPANLSNEYLYDLVNGQFDTKPDLFRYSLPTGESGTFLFDKNGVCYFFPIQDIRVEKIIDQGILTFTITNKLGQTFYFEDYEVTHPEDNCSTCPPPFNFLSDYISNWLLTKVEYPDIQDFITIEYVPNGEIYFGTGQASQTASVIINDAPTCCPNTQNITFNFSTNGSGSLQEKKRIYQIKTSFRQQEITFIGSISSIEPPGGSDDGWMFNTPSYAYKAMVLKIDQQQFQKVIFNTSYFPGFNWLRLDNIELYGSGTDYHSIIFEYFDGSMPHPDTKGVDHWGYFNGQMANQGLIPEEERHHLDDIQGVSLPDSYFGDRRPSSDTTYTNIGLLTDIQEPNGNTTEIYYEPNRYGYLGNEEVSEPIYETKSGSLQCRGFQIPGRCIGFSRLYGRK